MNNRLVPLLAQRIQSQIGQDTLNRTYPEMNKFLVTNKNISHQLFEKLFKKSKVDYAMALAKHPIDIEKFKLLLKDKRKGVRYTYFRNKDASFTTEICDEIISSSWFDAEYASIWLESGNVPVEYIKKIALIDNGNELIKSLKRRDLYEDQEVIDLIPQARHLRTQAALWELLEERPELIDMIFEKDSTNRFVLDAIAGSRYLLPDTAEKLVAQITERTLKEYRSSHVFYVLLANPATPLKNLKQLLELYSTYTFKPDYNQRFVLDYAQKKIEFMENNQLCQLPSPNWEESTGDTQNIIFTGVRVLNGARYKNIISQIRSIIYHTIPTLAKNNSEAQKSEEVIAWDQLLVTDSYLGLKLNKDHLSNLENILDTHGDLAWQVFWTLSAEWDGTLSSLLESAISLQK